MSRKNHEIEELKSIQKVMMQGQNNLEIQKMMDNLKTLEEENHRLKVEVSQGVIQNFKAENAFLRDRAATITLNLKRERDKSKDLED